MRTQLFSFAHHDNGRPISGQSLVLVTLFMGILFGFAALSLDGGRLYLDKKKLQNATDSAALAGAFELPPKNSGDTIYVTKAKAFAITNRVTDAEIESVEAGHFDPTSRTFTAGASPNDSIRVTAGRTLKMAFAQVIGIKTLTVRSHSVAQLFAADSVTGLAMPWVIELNTNSLPAKRANFILRTSNTPTGGTWRLPTDSNSGSEYRTRIENGFEGTLSVGDTIELVPGLKNGPTQQGVNYRIGLDPNATFATVQPNSGRIVVVPFVNPGFMGSGNGFPLKVVGFASFFLTGAQHGEVQGQYMNLFGGKSLSRRPPTSIGPNTALLVE